MKRIAAVALLAALCGMAGVSQVWAQHPIGTEFRVSTPRPQEQDKPRLIFGPGNGFAIVWSTFRPACEGCVSQFQVFWKVYSPTGQTIAEDFVEEPEIAGLFPPAVVRSGPDAFSVLWAGADEVERASLLLEKRVEWSTGAGADARILSRSPKPTQFLLNAAAQLPAGQLMVAGLGEDRPPEDGCSRCDYGAFGQALDSEGAPVTGFFQINQDSMGAQLPTSVAADGQGRFLVSWWGNPGGDGTNYDAYVRRYSATGEALGPQIRANTVTEGGQEPGGVAADTHGNFVVVWDSYPQDGSIGEIYAQRFDANAERVGPEFRVNTVTASAQYNSRVAMDRDGNFVVVWQSFDAGGVGSWDVKGQLFRKDGTPAGREFFVNTHLLLEQEAPYPAFADNGTFGVVWTSNSQDGAESHDIYAQRFSASPGDEPCWVRGGKVFCDTGRTGGGPEIEMTFGGRPGETLLSGDFDGDGRADLCARFGTRFRCDLDHRGAPAEAKVDFGLAGDTPLMGDLDGDGKAEVCVRRKRQFLCDTGHDGGKPETRIVFGLVSDTPLLGDLDGDGRDDPCLWRAGHFLCDTAHNGNGAEIDIAFGQASDALVLGDLDGDGRDDPCVLRAGHLLCDTAHDGGAAEVDLLLDTQAGNLPLIANFDAL